jgi:hypothetical protein
MPTFSAGTSVTKMRNEESTPRVMATPRSRTAATGLIRFDRKPIAAVTVTSRKATTTLEVARSIADRIASSEPRSSRYRMNTCSPKSIDSAMTSTGPMMTARPAGTLSHPSIPNIHSTDSRTPTNPTTTSTMSR